MQSTGIELRAGSGAPLQRCSASRHALCCVLAQCRASKCVDGSCQRGPPALHSGLPPAQVADFLRSNPVQGQSRGSVVTSADYGAVSALFGGSALKASALRCWATCLIYTSAPGCSVGSQLLLPQHPLLELDTMLHALTCRCVRRHRCCTRALRCHPLQKAPR